MTDQELAQALFQAGLLTAEQIQTVATRRTAEKNFAQAAVETGWLTPAQIAQFDPNALHPTAAQSMPPQGMPPQPGPPLPQGTPYGSAPTSPYGAPSASPYGAPPSAPQGAPSYGMPSQGTSPYGTAPYGAPAYNTPLPPNYGGVAPQRPALQRKPGVVDLSAVGQGWELVSAQLGMWVVTILVMQLVQGAWGQVAGLPMRFAMPTQPQINPQDIWGSMMAMYQPVLPYYILALVLQLPASAFLGGGVMMVALKQMRRGTIEIADLFNAGRYFWPLLGAHILMQIAGLFGLLGFCIGAFVVGGLFILTIPLILEQNLHPVEAMGKSWQTLQGQVGSATLVMVVLAVLQVAGVLACCVGIFVTLPIIYTTTAVLYDRFFPLDEIAPSTPPGPAEQPPIPSPF